jgi:GTP-binding protein
MKPSDCSEEIQPVVKRRVVAIIGRPNVGKSAVFNRIAGRRVAIVHDERGVTRDRLMREVTWNGERFTLVDTGGVSIPDVRQATDAIAAGTRRQVDAALQDAAVAILVTDVQSGLHPMDEAVARIVRKSGVPCLVAVNKADEPQHEAGAADFARLGFPLFAVSAAHDRGFVDLVDRAAALLPQEENETAVTPLRIAVVGRPNAGKSSYINRLLKSDRVIVSEVPGTTRDSIEIPFAIGSGPQARHYTLIDTAGMRNVHAIDNSVERFSHFRSEQSLQEADIVVLMMDAEAGPTMQDKHIAAKVIEARKGCVLIVNKWDLSQAKGITQTQAEPALFEAMGFMAYCPVVFISAKDGYNVRKSIDVIDAVAAQTRSTLPTGMLNRAVEEACERIQMPTCGRKHLNVFYATQTGVAPIRLRVFVNDVKLVKKAFIDYLERKLRERFGLEGAPVVLAFRERPRPDREGGKAAAAPARASSNYHVARKARNRRVGG